MGSSGAAANTTTLPVAPSVSWLVCINLTSSIIFSSPIFRSEEMCKWDLTPWWWTR